MQVQAQPEREPPEEEQLVLVRLAHEYLQQFLSLGSLFFTWQPKKSMRTDSVSLCVVEVATDMVHATAKLEEVLVVENFSQLRSLAAFQGASPQQKSAWRNRDLSGQYSTKF